LVYILFKCGLPPNKKKEFHELYEYQMELLEKHGGKIIGVWDVEMGPCSEFMVLWAAKDLSAYEKTLQALREDEDPKGRELSEKWRPMLSNCERWLLRPTAYSPLK